MFSCNSSTENNESQTRITDTTSSKVSANSRIANEFADAFYSFNAAALSPILDSAGDSKGNILFYQKWAECGNYKELNRAAVIEKSDTLIILPVTVKDDLMMALEQDLNVTDSFHLTIKNGRITSVNTSSNDPEIFYQARQWINTNRKELVDKPCSMDPNNSNPCDCIKGMLKGLREFVQMRKDSISRLK